MFTQQASDTEPAMPLAAVAPDVERPRTTFGYVAKQDHSLYHAAMLALVELAGKLAGRSGGATGSLIIGAGKALEV